MSINEKVRSAEFRMAYWQRAEEMAPLVLQSQRDRLLGAAKSTLGRKDAKRFAQALGQGFGVLAIDDVDAVCKRFGLWTVRRKLDWGRHNGGYPHPSAKMLDEELTGGIYDLDVNLRREVERLLKSGRQDVLAANHLRAAVEARAGEVAATIDVSHTTPWANDHWDEVEKYFDEVCNSLDHLLVLAGARSPDA